MEPLPQMAPVSDLKHRHLDVFKRLKNGPVVLSNRSQPTAVLISPEKWNALAEYIDDLECSLEALKTELSLARGEEEVIRLTDDELREWLGEDEIPD